MTGYAGPGTPEGPVASPFPDRQAWPTVDLGTTPSDDDALALVPESYAAANDLIPLWVDDGTLVIACADPGNEALLSELQALARPRVRALGAPRVEIQEAIQGRYQVLEHVDEHVQVFTQRLERPPSLEARPLLRAVDGQSPVVNVVNLIITEALRDRAPDVHLEPQRTHLRVRFRIDGILIDRLRLPQSIAPFLSSRLKVMADLDIVGRHRAQDGQFRFESDGHQVDVRVSTMETLWGRRSCSGCSTRADSCSGSTS